MRTVRQGHAGRTLVQRARNLAVGGGRRMAATALHIDRKVLPDCPVRQWVLSVPFAVRRLLAADARLFGAVVKLFARVVERFCIERARAAGIEGAKTGALSFQQRFGGSLNSHCPVHAAWVDAVFSLDPSTSKTRFQFPAPPTPRDVQRVAATVAVRVYRMLRRKVCCASHRTTPRRRRPSTTLWMRAATSGTAEDGSSASTRVDGRSRSCSPISPGPLRAEPTARWRPRSTATLSKLACTSAPPIGRVASSWCATAYGPLSPTSG